MHANRDFHFHSTKGKVRKITQLFYHFTYYHVIWTSANTNTFVRQSGGIRANLSTHPTLETNNNSLLDLLYLARHQAIINLVTLNTVQEVSTTHC